VCVCMCQGPRAEILPDRCYMGKRGRVRGDNRRRERLRPLADANMWEVRKARPIPSSPGEKERNENVECGAD